MCPNRTIALPLLAVIFGACGGAEEHPPAVPGQSQQESSLEWSLNYNVQCDPASVRNCVGAYGFKISSNGEYQIGPGPQGQFLVERIDKTDLEAIKVAHFSREAENCVDSAASPQERRDSLSLTIKDESVDLIRQTDSQFCFAGMSETDARRLRNRIQELAERYYPLPFPNPCIDAAMSLRQLHRTVQSCETDEDCAFIDADYGPIKAGHTQRITVDDCTYLKPLSVANVFSVTARQLELITAKEIATEICGQNLVRPACPSLLGFLSGAARPVCESGTCQLGPEVQLR